MLAIGTTSGRFTVLNAYNGAHVTSVQVGSEQLDAVKFSPGEFSGRWVVNPTHIRVLFKRATGNFGTLGGSKQFSIVYV